MTPMVLWPGAVLPLWYTSLAVVAGVAAVAVWRAEARDLDRPWLMTLLASLLCSPLGWSYYIPLASGPTAVLAIRGSRSVKVLIAIGYACFLMPYTFLVLEPLGRLATATIGSVYFWGTASWFVAAACPPRSIHR